MERVKDNCILVDAAAVVAVVVEKLTNLRRLVELEKVCSQLVYQPSKV